MRSMTLRKAKQKGFTLLELLVVITLLAILATGALLAYEGLTDTAQGAAASNNTASADQSIRNYKAVTGKYPDQWDNLVVAGTGASLPFSSTVMNAWLGDLTLTVPAAENDARDRILKALDNVGITELQSRIVATSTAGVEPNLQHNEGALGAAAATDVQEAPIVEKTATGLFVGGTLSTAHVAVLPTWNGDTNAACVMPTGVTLAANKLNGVAISIADARRINAINDALEDDQCNLVIALGFGHDAAHSTTGTPVTISAAPTFTSKNVNPADNYARYVALFHVASDKDEDGTIDPTDVFQKARLIAVVDTEGKAIDQNIAVANDNTAN